MDYALLITLSKTAITAITNRIWITPPASYTKNPKIQPITTITAIKYNIFLIINLVYNRKLVFDISKLLEYLINKITNTNLYFSFN